MLEKSIDELMCECYNTSLEICYEIEGDRCIKPKKKPKSLTDELWDELWSFAEGGYQKWFFDTIDGRCSPQRSLDFDMQKEEEYMREFLKKAKLIKLATI